MASAADFVLRVAGNVGREVRNLDSLRDWVATHGAELDRNPAAWCAIELALLDLFARRAGCPVERLLGLPALAGSFRYSAIVGIEPPDVFARVVGRYRSAGFRDFKLKLSGDVPADRDRLHLLQRIPGTRVRVDANNLWSDARTAIAHLKVLDGAWAGIEEPLSPRDWDGLGIVSKALGTRIILDESCARIQDLGCLGNRPGRWIVNVRVSKMGGVLRALEFAARASAAGIALIVGAHVGETSLLTRAALTVATAARSRLLAQEGAFGNHLLEQDPCTPALTFGRGGELPASAVPGLPGWGLDFRAPDEEPIHG
jgi:L-alanine-DL-glutamate epimerase-like enolase superfamily enzyme